MLVYSETKNQKNIGYTSYLVWLTDISYGFICILRSRERGGERD